MPYIEYIKREAQRRGLVEKMGQMVDPQTRKADRGQECEQAILGRCIIGRAERMPVPADRTSETYQKAKHELFGFARTHQPIESERDEENVAKEIESMIATKLKENNLDIGEVRFYTAVGTPLDYQCGVDGWVEITNQDNKKELITFDLKTGSHANSSIQADIILKLDLKDDGFTARETLNELFRFTNEVVDVYKERVSLNGQY
ncbi:MAG: hypothetical protein KAT32_00075 [Candidatus Moranbacteria bacterium]|nr:hypothetical protein [Candidatus Moranbacteria bacterium]